MKEKFIFIYIFISCLADDILKPTPNVNSFDTAIEIMTARKFAGKSLCLSENSPTEDEIMEIKAVIAKVLSKQVDDQMVDEAAREFIDEYSKTRSDDEEINKFIHENFLDKNCQTRDINKDNPVQEIIDEFSSKKSKMLNIKSAQVVAFSCAVEILYNAQLRYAQSDTKGKERRIVEMSYFGHRIKNNISGALYDGINLKLVINTEILFEKISNIGMSPEENIVKCFLKKAEASYESSELEYFGGIYRMLIYNLNEIETCYIRKLSRERQSFLSNLFSQTEYDFNEVEIKAIIDSFESLVYDLDYINIFGISGLYEYLETYVNLTQCTFDNDKFSSNFKSQIQNINNNIFGKTKLVNVGQVVALFCVLSELRNTPQVAFDNDYKNNITRIMDIYTFFLNSFKEESEEAFTAFLYRNMNTVRYDSRKIDNSFKEGYYYKLKYACILKNGQTSFKERFQPVLYALESFMNTVYSPLHCHNKIWNKEDFTIGVMNLLLGIIDYDMISLEFIYESTARILDQSSELKDVHWTKFIHFDGESCLVQKDINYQTLKFDENSKPTNDYNSYKESLISRCSSINLLARAVIDSEQPLSLQDKALICSTYIYLFKTAARFRLLPVEEKVIAIKIYIGNKTLTHKQAPGRKGLLECEIHRVSTNGSFYEYPLFISLYSLVVDSFFDDQSCSYKFDTFNNDNLPYLSGVLMKHPEFQDSDFDTVVTYIIPNLKIIFQEYDALFSRYKLDSEFTNRLVNTKTCILDEFDDVKLLNEIYNFIFETYTHNFPYKSQFVVKVFTCYALKGIKSAKDKLKNKNKLPSSDITALDELVSKVLVEYPHLKEKTPANFKYLLMNVSITEKFNDMIDSSLKASIAECNLRKLYFKDNSSSCGSSDNSVNCDAGNTNDTGVGENKLSSGAIAGIVIGTLLGVGILGGGIIYYVKVKTKFY